MAIHGYYHYQMALYYKVKFIVYLQFILEITNVYSLGLWLELFFFLKLNLYIFWPLYLIK